MESSQTQRSGFSSLVQGAIDDLREAGEDANDEVRVRIDSALEQLRDAATTVGAQLRESAQELQSQAEDGTDELLERLDSVRAWIRGASADLVDEIQAEVDRRRAQLTSRAAGPGRSDAPGSSAGVSKAGPTDA